MENIKAYRVSPIQQTLSIDLIPRTTQFPKGFVLQAILKIQIPYFLINHEEWLKSVDLSLKNLYHISTKLI